MVESQSSNTEGRRVNEPRQFRCAGIMLVVDLSGDELTSLTQHNPQIKAISTHRTVEKFLKSVKMLQ